MPKTDTIEPLYSKAIQKLSDFRIKDYNKLSEAEKNLLREEYSKLPPFIEPEYHITDIRYIPLKDINSHLETFHDKFAEALKKKFDKKYGKDKYEVIIIGRSLSSVGKVLGYKIGEDKVKNIPMSVASNYLDEKWMKKITEAGHLNKFREYLNSIGLKKEEIEKSKKKYIILDYCVSGKSLNGAEKLLTRDDILGSKNIVKKDVLKCITNKKLRDSAKGYLHYCSFKQFSFVSSTQWLDNLKYATNRPQQEPENIKLMWFKLLDNEMIKQEEAKQKPKSLLSTLLSKLF